MTEAKKNDEGKCEISMFSFTNEGLRRRCVWLPGQYGF